MNLTEAVALVTGGSQRIGREVGRHLAQAGVDVVVHYLRSATAAQQAVAEFRALGVRSTAIQADLAHPVAAAQALFERANESLGPVSVLINSAAIFEPGFIANTSEELWDAHQNINLKAPFFLTQEFVKQLPVDRDAAVINLIDWRAERPVPGHDAYTVAKSGLCSLTRLLAQELGPRIRVNGIAPGAILPPPGESPDDFRRRGANNPLQRTGDPAQIAQAAMYLLQAEFVTGEILHVTGGEELGTASRRL